MSVYRSCLDCKGTLGEIDLTSGNMMCISCNAVFNIKNFTDTTMHYIKTESKSKELTNFEIQRLGLQTTTSRIVKECPSCKFNVMGVVHDDLYNFSYVCIKCKSVYSN